MQPEGTCICDQYGCSKVLNGGWVHADYCPTTGSSTNAAVRLWQTSNVQSAASYPTIRVAVGGREYRLNTAMYEPLSSDSSLSDAHPYQPPALASAPKQGWGVTADYSNTDFSSAMAIGGEVRKSRQFSLDFQYAKDFDDWGFLVSVPVKRQENNGLFSAMDDTSLGLSVLPFYHVLHQKVHGVDLDVGAILGYEQHWIKDKAALTNSAGSFALAGFDDPRSFQIGALARLGVQRGATGFSAGLSHISVENLANKDIFGTSTALTSLDFALTQSVAAATVLGLDVTQSHLQQTRGEVDRNFGTLGLSLARFGRRSQWEVRAHQSLDNSNYNSRGLQCSFRWVLD